MTGERRTRARLRLAVAGVLCVLLLGACSQFSSSSGGGGASATTSGGTDAPANACTLLTKPEVAQATGNSIALSKQANVGSVSSCTFGSLSGFAIVLSVTKTSVADLAGNIPGLGNVVANYSLTPVSGVGDQAYGGSNGILVRKGNTVFAIVYADIAGGGHEQVLKTMATEVAARL